MHHDRNSPASHVPTALVAAGAAALAAVAVALSIEGFDHGSKAAGKPVAVALGIGLLGLAAVRFEAFVFALILVRPSLDALGGQTGSFSPASVLGILFIVAGSVWLVTRWTSGEWVRTSLGTRALYAFAVAAAASVVVSVDRHASIVAFARVLSGVLMFGVLEQMLAGRLDRWRQLLVVGIASSVVPVIVGLYQISQPGESGFAVGDLNRVKGTFVHPNTFATYLVIVVLAMFAAALRVHGWARFALVAWSVPVLVTLVETYSRGAYLGFIIGGAYLAWRRQPFLLIPFAAAIAAVAIAVPSVGQRFADLGRHSTPYVTDANSLSWRVHYWPRVIHMARNSPIDGIGLETVVKTSPEQLQPHNIWVQAYAETGAIGALALAGVVVGTGATLFQRRRHARGTGLAAAAGGVAIALSLLSQSLSENILDETVVYWAAAAMMAWGLSAERVLVPDHERVPLRWARPQLAGAPA